jgi:hypothetical protein
MSCFRTFFSGRWIRKLAEAKAYPFGTRFADTPICRRRGADVSSRTKTGDYNA